MTRPPLPPFTPENATVKVRIAVTDRRFHWPAGRRPDAHPGLSELGL